MPEPKLNLRSLLQDHKAKARRSSTVRIPWTLDGELADRHDELSARRDVVAAKLRLLQRESTDDERASGPTGLADEASAELAELDAELEELRTAGEAATVHLLFRTLTSTRYAEVYNAAIKSSDEAAEQWDAFLHALVAECFVGAEQAGEVDKTITWPEILEATDSEGSPLMPFGHVDAIHSMVVAANKASIDTPFS